MRTVLFLSACLFASVADARRCVLNGEEVNPDNGSTTAGKTGVLTCYRDDGSLWYEQALKDGEHLGLDRFHDEDGSVRERSVNAQGNTEGLAREWYPGGQLKVEGEYRNATPVGEHRAFHPDGSRKSVRIYVKDERSAGLSIEWDAVGKLRELRCAAQSLSKLDVELCGHGQARTVELHDQRGQLSERRTLQGGRVSRSEHFDREGKLRGSVDFQAEGRVERELHPNGELARELVVEGGYRTQERTWYMNGALKSQITREPVERNARSIVESYADTGLLAQRETSIDGQPQKRERFDAAARLAEDWEYAPEGHVARHRKFDANGTVVLDEAFYPDGSRKLVEAEAAIAR